MSNFLIPDSFAISVVRHKNEDGICNYNAMVELNADDDMVLLATDIFSQELYDCALEATATAIRFAGKYVDDINMFECDGTPIRERVPFTVSDLVAALDDPDALEEQGSERTLH